MDTRNGLLLIVIVLLALCAFVGTASAKTWYVDDGGGADFTRIQDAVGNASEGDTIIVRDGVYVENLVVSKCHLTIRSESGHANCIVRGVNPNQHVVAATADYVDISGFTIKRPTFGYFYFAEIYLYFADYCDISNNLCSETGGGNGIWLRNSNNNSISNNVCSKSGGYGIYLDYSNSTSIFNNTCSKSRNAIRLRHSNSNTISNNICSSNTLGICLIRRSNNNTISNNNCSSNRYQDVSLASNCHNNTISNNICSSCPLPGSNMRGSIGLRNSSNNKLTGNALLNSGIYIWCNSLSNYVQEIDTSNTVKGKPIYYWKGVEEGRIPDGAGQVILVNCTNISVEDQNLKNASIGIQIAFSSYITIKNNLCSLNDYGVYFDHSNNNNVSNNNLSYNGHSSILPGHGIILVYSSNNSISNNNCSNNFGSTDTRNSGIHLLYSNNNSISHNTCSKNNEGISLSYSNNNYISNNILCEGIALTYGIYFTHSNNNKISNNNCSNNRYGIHLSSSNNNSISSNNCLNNGYGIDLKRSSSNKIVLNNFVNNNNNAKSYKSTNIWNSISKITYTHNRNTYMSYLGNYWDDYSGTDAYGNEIGDTAYRIGGDRDYYPLMMRFENYV